MKYTTTLPTLGQSVGWTAVFYTGFGLILSILGWFIITASSNILLKMIGLNIPGWATGWVLISVMVPLFALLGAISGAIIYLPIKALIQYFHKTARPAA
ncbi:MAG TPA: hypothetical protein VN452_02785 [Longilinea sp.]|nr:hypothetical protein [Longilinea sp.]